MRSITRRRDLLGQSSENNEYLAMLALMSAGGFKKTFCRCLRASDRILNCTEISCEGLSKYAFAYPLIYTWAIGGNCAQLDSRLWDWIAVGAVSGKNPSRKQNEIFSKWEKPRMSICIVMSRVFAIVCYCLLLFVIEQQGNEIRIRSAWWDQTSQDFPCKSQYVFCRN